jgi:hypothetical protein
VEGEFEAGGVAVGVGETEDGGMEFGNVFAAASAGFSGCFDPADEFAVFHDGLEEFDGFGFKRDGFVAEGFVGIDHGDCSRGQGMVDVVDGIGDECSVLDETADLQTAGNRAFGALFAELDARLPGAVGWRRAASL